MKKIALIFTLSIFSSAAFSISVTCSPQEALSGTFETEVREGFPPNVLNIKRAAEGEDFVVSVASYWSPKPYDNGEHVTVGNFQGNLRKPQPWSCVGFIEVGEGGSNEDDLPVSCTLLLRFFETTRVEVTAIGHCEYLHGHRAYPDGTYVKHSK